MTTADRSAGVTFISGINVVLGAWLIISPWLYGYAAADLSTVTSVIVGTLIMHFSASRYSLPHQGIGLSTCNIALGAFIALCPLIFAYTTDFARFYTTVIVGVAVIALSTWSARSTAQERDRRHLESTNSIDPTNIRRLLEK